MPQPVSPPIFAYYHLLTNWFSWLQTITNNGQLCTFVQRSQPMGGVDPDAVGISWYLSLPIMIPGKRCNLVRALSPLPCRGMGRHREAPVQYGISFGSTRQGHQGGEGVWPGSCVGTPTLSMPLLPGWGSMETRPTLWHMGWLKPTPSCGSIKTPCTYPYPAIITSVPYDQ